MVFILIIVVLLFGAKKLPELARGLGRSLGEFKKARDEFERELHSSASEVEAKTPLDKQAAQPAPEPAQGSFVQKTPRRRRNQVREFCSVTTLFPVSSIRLRQGNREPHTARTFCAGSCNLNASAYRRAPSRRAAKSRSGTIRDVALRLVRSVSPPRGDHKANARGKPVEDDGNAAPGTAMRELERSTPFCIP